MLMMASLSAGANPSHEHIATDSTDYPRQDFFLRATIPQRYLDEAEGKIIVRLTEEDYADAAEKLGIDIAAIKAVIDIETGRTRCGFISPRTPIIDFDTKIFHAFCRRRGISTADFTPHVTTAGTQQQKEHIRLDRACLIDSVTAKEATMWGMFQIAGFNWKRCGAESLDDFVEKMCYSERTQLELFTNFLLNTDLVKYLRAKNWRAFAYRYNGPKYTRFGYHTRLAQAYYKHSK